MGSLLARAYKRILRGKLAQDEGEHWVTVNAGSKEGGEGGGSHVLLDGEGRVVAGMGGKFKGQNIDRIERKKFINQNAWNRQRKALIEKAGDDTQLKRVVTAGMRSQAEKEADKSNDTWQKEGLYNALVRRTQRENKGMINVLHDHLDHKNAQPKAVNPIAEKIQKQSDGIKQIVTEAITKYNDLEAVNQLNSVPDGVNVVTEKGQFFKTGDLWSSPDGKKTLENDQMFRLLKKELKAKQEAPKTDRKSLIDQVNARHTMPMGDIIARKEQAITDKINNSNLSEEDKKKYLDKLNSLTDEALKAGAGSLDLYKVGVSYKKTNAETNAFNKMFNKQGEIDNLEKEINKKVQDNVTQAENKLTSNSLNEAERTGAVYFMDPNGKEFYRAHSKSKTWYQINQYNQAKGEKAKAKQEALNAKKQQEAPKTDRKSLIDQVNARHTMPMGDIIARKEQAITDKINNSNLSDETKKKYLDRLNHLTDLALQAGTEDSKARLQRALRPMEDFQHEIDKLENGLEGSLLVQRQRDRAQNIFYSSDDAEKWGAVYFKDPSGKEYYRANANSKTWNSVNDANREKADKAREKQETLNYEKKANSTGLGTFKFDGGKITISEVEKNGRTETHLKIDRGMLPTEIKQLLQSKRFNVNPVKRTWWHIGSMPADSRKDILKALDAQAVAPKPEGEPRTMKNAFSDKYQKIDNSNLNKYQEVDNISNNKNTENGVTNMNTNQESQATAEAKSLEDQYRADPLRGHAFKDGSMQIGRGVEKDQQSAVVKFYNQPEQSTIDMLKQNGFEWMPSKKSWVHKGEIGNKSHLDVLKALKGVAPAPQPSQATPTAQPTTSQAAQPTAYDVLNAKTPDAVSKADLSEAIETLKNNKYAVTEQNIKKALQWRKHSKLADDLIAQSPKSFKLKDLQTQAGLQSIFPKDIDVKADWKAYNYHTGYEPTTRHAGYESGNKKTKPYNDLVNNRGNIVMFANKDGSQSGYGLITDYVNGVEVAHLITPETHASVTDHRIKQGDQSISGYIANEEAKEKASRETERQARIAKEGKSYNGTGIEYKNGRYEISFNSFPSFQLRTDMKNNGFRWDPNAKVWHTTDREKLDQVLSKHFSERDAGESPTQA